MKSRLAKLRLALAAMAAWPIASAWSQTEPGQPLSVCLQQNDPPLSLRSGDKPSGFDLALSEIIAKRLGRELRIQWFVSRDDPDASLALDANALLSDGRCQLLADYPLTASTLERPRSPSARLPPFDGAKPDDRHRRVQTGDLAATRPYRLDALTVVLSAHEADQSVRKLADLDGLRIGVQLATLADAITMRYQGGRLREHVVHVTDARDLFQQLQDRKLDAAVVDLRAFDAWRLKHGSAGMVASDYRHSLAFNMGFVGLAAEKPLIDQVDAVLADLQAHNAIAPLAAQAGLTFTPPRSPDVQPDAAVTALSGD